MTIEKTNVQHVFSNGVDNYTHVTNNADYEFVELYEGDYCVTELDKEDVIKLCNILNITGEHLTA